MNRRFSSYTVKAPDTHGTPIEKHDNPFLCIEGDSKTSFLSYQLLFPEKIILPMRFVLKRYMPQNLFLVVNQRASCPLYLDTPAILESITLFYEGEGGTYYKEGTRHPLVTFSSPYSIAQENSSYCHRFFVLSHSITETSSTQHKKAIYYPYGGIFQKDPMGCQQLYIQALDKKTTSDYLLIREEHFDKRRHAHRISFFSSTPEDQPISLGKALLQGACTIVVHHETQKCLYKSFEYSEFFNGNISVSFIKETESL